MGAAGISPVKGPAQEGTRVKLAREPLFWAASSAFVGVALGVFGTLRRAATWGDYYPDPVAQMLADVPGFLGEALCMLSVLGIAYLLWRSLRAVWRRAILLGTVSLSLLVASEAVGVTFSVYINTGGRWRGFVDVPFSGLVTAASWAVTFLPFVVFLPFAVVSFLARERRFGLVLSGLSLLAVPYGFIWFLLVPPESYSEPTNALVLYALGWFPAGVSLLEAPLLVLLGLMLLRRARSRAVGEAFRVRERENLRAARRLYEEGLARGDLSVLGGLVSEDLRDPGRGPRGRLAVERAFSALWRSYPDLAVSIEHQEAEDDLVRTRLIISGTDRGGVLWYPPTGRRATFAADFTDRFLNGQLIEHSGETDTEDLLRQLGLTQSQAPET